MFVNQLILPEKQPVKVCDAHSKISSHFCGFHIKKKFKFNNFIFYLSVAVMACISLRPPRVRRSREKQ